ncbi:hypothetical protein OG730_23485 [Streptomyces sp. NBC_01298]|uniref:hypothetical protein n=1 Tax=Streptomyces sp. NBC_01298 TaxID=2903817 RepID=UPI002E11C817|nr:hypothetical protein OG730_23485 [Streptomyces sp. NBC_01298]
MEMQVWRDCHQKADDATAAMQEALAGLGLPDSAWSGIQGRVTNSGRAYVHMGMLRAEHVERIAEAIRSGLGPDHVSRPPAPAQHR